MILTEEQVLQTLMKWRTRVSAAAWVVVRDTQAAEDIFQNVALKALTKDVSFEAEGAVLSWAFITARREGIDWLRRYRREAVHMDVEILKLLEKDWVSETLRPGGLKIEALQTCLESIPDKSRQLLRFRYSDGYSCEEVADRIGIQLNAVYKRLSRLHQILKDCIESRMNDSNKMHSRPTI
ncbi:MAG TPA: sigma-70 family RNA polymerase sigma factor [Verrucomicrobiales bacterium]|nr:sigma-70 family RNA polymerase sigma factor [Verrucomicrobiales bacterium]HIL71587.1 sigma-70 family RNA polymerase sigma factor [Verrucomicrobiota bacterium]